MRGSEELRRKGEEAKGQKCEGAKKALEREREGDGEGLKCPVIGVV
jgi:hypothetical protein